MIRSLRLKSFLILSSMHGTQVLAAQMPANPERPFAQGSLGGRIMYPEKFDFNDAQFDEMVKKLGRDCGAIVGKKAVHSIEVRAYRRREALLPALFLWRRIRNSSSMFDCVTQRMNAVAKVYRENRAVATALPYKTILSVSLLSEQDEIVIADLQHPATDYVRIIGRKLRQNELAIVGYADGTHEFKLSDADRDVAHSLSHEQLDLIIDLYQTHDATWLIRAKQYEKTLNSIPLNIRIKLAWNYMIPSEFIIPEALSDTCQRYAKAAQDLEATKQKESILRQEKLNLDHEKRNFEQEKGNMAKEIDDMKWTIRCNKFDKERLEKEHRDRSFWKRHGHVMMATIAAFAVGWMGKSYWGPISSAAVSWFKGLKVKWGYR